MKHLHPERDLDNPADILHAIRKIQTLFIKEHDPRATFSAALEAMLEVTGSEFGFLDEVVVDEKGERYKFNLALSDIAWDDDSRKLYHELLAHRLEFRNLANLAGLPVLENRTVISNDALHDNRSGSLPKGHPPIHTYMGVPMIFGGEVVGVAGLANRKEGYTEEMAVLLEPLLTAYTGIIMAARMKRREREHLATLQANEEKFRTVADFTYDWEHWISPGGEILYMSPSCERISGYSVDEFLADPKLLKKIVHPDDRGPMLMQVRNGTHPPTEVENLDYRIITRTGEERWINHYSVPVFRNDGAYLGLRTSCRDITERRRAGDELTGYHAYLEDLVKERTAELERRNMELAREISNHKKTECALRESETLYRLLAANASDIIFTMDNDLRFTYISPSITRIRGYSVEEAMSQSLAEALTPESLEVAIKCYQEELETESKNPEERHRTYTVELEETCKDGSTIWTETTFSSLRDEGGARVGLLGITRDISKRKQAEDEKKSLMNRFIQTQKMEALGKFAGGIVHDLNNFLYPILVNTQMLLEESTPNSSFHQTLKQTHEAIYRLRDLIKQILAFSRSGEQQLSPVHVKPLVKETLALLKSNIPSRVKIKQVLNGPLDIVQGDPTHIQQIIMNLCMNAVDSMEARTGKIEVRLENVRLDPAGLHAQEHAGDYLCLSVEDSGMGMTEEVLEHIFEPFFTTKELGKGTGMGLSVIHGIIRNHKGFINVKSEPGKGSQFNIYLPLFHPEPIAKEQTPYPAKGNKTVLLIDDEEMILKSVQRMLKVFGYDVITVKGGIEAIEVFSRIPECIDLVMTDLAMPGMNGIDLAGRLINIRHDIPIVLCTGFNDAVNLPMVKEIGIKALLEKPADIDEIKSAINQALGHDDKNPGVKGA